MKHFEIETLQEDDILTTGVHRQEFWTFKLALRWLRKHPDSGAIRVNYLSQDKGQPVKRTLMYVHGADGVWITPPKKNGLAKALNIKTGDTFSYKGRP